MTYFSNIISENLKVDIQSLKINPDFFIKQRKNRELIKNSFKLKKFLIGDILEFVYTYRSIPLVFCGICIAIKRKSFVMPDLVLILRNIVVKTGIELTLSYFYIEVINLNFWIIGENFLRLIKINYILYVIGIIKKVVYFNL